MWFSSVEVMGIVLPFAGIASLISVISKIIEFQQYHHVPIEYTKTWNCLFSLCINMKFSNV